MKTAYSLYENNMISIYAKIDKLGCLSKQGLT